MYNNNQQILQCRRCGQDICFDEERVSERSGKLIPLDPETNKPHDCPEAPKLFCKDCGKEICFSNGYLSMYGKKVPLSKASGRPHKCKAKPFNRETRRAWWHEQQQKAYEERARRREEQRKQEERKEFNRRFYEEWEKERNNVYDPNQDREREGERAREEARKESEDYRRRSDEARERYRRERYRREQYYQSTNTAKNLEYCKILQIPITATKAMIEEAYRKLCFKFHPDRYVKKT